MAEEQEKQKPKATLIKQRKAEPEPQASGDEARKVRVVVKRKPKAKVVLKRKSPEPTADSGAQASPPREASPTAEATPEPRQQSQPTTTAATEPAAAEAPRPAPRPEAKSSPDNAAPRAEASTRPVGRDTDAPARPAPRESDVSTRPSGRDAGAPVRRPAAADDGPRRPWSPTSATQPARNGGASPRSTGMGRGPRPTGDRNRPPAPGQQRGAPRGPGGPPQRPGFDRGGPRPGGGGGRGPGGPGGGPGGFRSGPRPGGPRPGGPPTGGAPRGEGTPPAQQKGAGNKKFYKSRKGRGGFDREEQIREKELNFARKKNAPKANPVPREIDIMEVITVSELARKMNLKAGELIGKLMGMGMMVTINQQIDAETAEILAAEYSCKVKIVSLYDETIIETAADGDDDLVTRPPIVTIMGHVDHGKTKLLDAIRSTNVVAGEHGGITQHIGAYQVAVDRGVVTFLDTPGHAAFSLMRARGAQITDVVVLVVAANDGVMPQTVEAINHAKDAGTPIIVAVNKVDLPEANVDRVKQQLSEHGLMPDDWGGDTAFIEVSALQKEGIDDLLEAILLQAEVMELKANFDRDASGKVIESRIDAGRGTVASVLIERGTLKVGDSFVAGIYAGRVRAMFNDRGDRVDEAGPAMPVEILGCDGVPEAGDPFQVTEDDKTARQVGSKRQELKRVEEARNVKKITLDNLYASIQEGEVQELKVVIKGDVHGSVEALRSSLEKLSTAEVRLNVIQALAGAINEGDVMLASASNALVIGFHVRPTPRAQSLAEREKVDIRKYNIIYDAVEDIRSAMEGLLAPDLQEEIIGSAEVREIFRVPKIGVIAGSYVKDGTIRRNAQVRVFRDGVQLYEGQILSLKRFKDDAREVQSGYECGIGTGYQELEIGDTLEAFVVKEVAKKLV